jgi:hypothetical protein
MSYELWDILNDRKTRENITTMYDVGIEECRESAFAVYKKEMGSIAVSDLLLPHIASTDILQPGTIRAHTSVDTSPLTMIHPEIDDLIAYDLTTRNAMDDHGSLSEKTRRTIANIKNSDLDTDEQTRLIEAVVKKELKQPEPHAIWREDVALLAHNHPIVPFDPKYSKDMNRLLAPSDADLEVSAVLEIGNPGIVSMIIGARHDEYGALLYRPEPGTNPNLYAYSKETILKHGISTVESLRTVGYRAVSLALTPKGRPLKDEREKLGSF